MKILSVELDVFLTYAGAPPVDLPDGVTVVVGSNGAGKTALGLEAICWCLWGKTTRGTTPEGDVTVVAEAAAGTFRVRRVRTPGRLRSLEMDEILPGGAGGGVPYTGQTPTETQAKVVEALGTWERFCAERVFSSRLRARFGSSTDKERKALLESVLGLERYERAAKLARAALSEREGELADAEAAERAARDAVSRAERMLGEVPPAMDDAASLRAATADLRRQIDEAEAEVARADEASGKAVAARSLMQRAQDRALADGRALLDRQREVEARVRSNEGKLDDLRKEALSRQEMTSCPLCLTDGGKIDREKLRLHYEPKFEGLSGERSDLTNEILDIKRRVDIARLETLEGSVDLQAAQARASDADRARSAARATLASLNARMVSQASALAAEEQRGAREAAARRAVDAACADLEGALEAVAEAARAALTARAAADALGSRGARVRRMDGALAALTREANAVLARLPVDGRTLRVLISGRRELARGGEVDEVSIAVEGAGGGEYDGASDGERVRLDVALMLGLARMGGGAGFVVLDEVFDPLDAEGLEAARDLLVELGRTRQVVVITHNPRFLDLLPGDACWRVSRGAGGSVVERAQ